jgi:hypothetical protein
LALTVAVIATELPGFNGNSPETAGRPCTCTSTTE